MPKKGYHQSKEHKNKRSLAIKKYIEKHGNNMLGRKHSEETLKKLRRSKSIVHIEKIRVSMKLYRERIKPIGWLIEPKRPVEPIPPQTYKDIFMDYDSSWEGIIDKL